MSLAFKMGCSPVVGRMAGKQVLRVRLRFRSAQAREPGSQRGLGMSYVAAGAATGCAATRMRAKIELNKVG